MLDSTNKIQDAYSIRCAPQVIGAARDAIVYARKIVNEEINAATDNPLIFLDIDSENKSRSGGNFHGEVGCVCNEFVVAWRLRKSAVFPSGAFFV